MKSLCSKFLIIDIMDWIRGISWAVALYESLKLQDSIVESKVWAIEEVMD